MAFLAPFTVVHSAIVKQEEETARLRAAGICTICGKAPAVENDEQCMDCALQDQAGA